MSCDELVTQETRVQKAADDVSGNRPVSVYRLDEMPIQSCGHSVSAPCGKAGARLNAHTELRQSVSARRRKRYTEVLARQTCRVCGPGEPCAGREHIGVPTSRGVGHLVARAAAASATGCASRFRNASCSGKFWYSALRHAAIVAPACRAGHLIPFGLNCMHLRVCITSMPDDWPGQEGVYMYWCTMHDQRGTE